MTLRYVEKLLLLTQLFVVVVAPFIPFESNEEWHQAMAIFLILITTFHNTLYNRPADYSLWQLYPAYIASLLVLVRSFFPASCPSRLVPALSLCLTLASILSCVFIPVGVCLPMVVENPKFRPATLSSLVWLRKNMPGSPMASPKRRKKEEVKEEVKEESGKSPLKGKTVDLDVQGIMVKIWYPTLDTSGTKATYMSSMLLTYLSRMIGNYSRLFVHHIHAIETNSFEDGCMAFDSAGYPVILFSHGLRGRPEIYSIYAEALASCGYIVVSVCHTDGTSMYVEYPDKVNIHYLPLENGRRYASRMTPEEKSWRISQAKTRAEDVSFVLDVLLDIQKGKNTSAEENETLSSVVACMRLDKVYAMGHSFGAATCVELCKTDDRIKTALMLDGWLGALDIDETLDVLPSRNARLLFVNSDLWQWEENLTHMKQVCVKAATRSNIIKLESSHHLNYSDTPFWAPLFLSLTKAIGRTDAAQILAMSTKACVDFIREDYDSLLKIPGSEALL